MNNRKLQITIISVVVGCMIIGGFLGAVYHRERNG